MLRTDDIRQAAERAAAGAGIPFQVHTIRRRADDQGWLISFMDMTWPAAGPVFTVNLADTWTPEQAAQAIWDSMSAHNREVAVTESRDAR